MCALRPAIGINCGADQYDRVIQSYKIFGLVAMLLTLPFWFIALIAPGSILGMMLPFMSFIFMAMTLFPAVDKGMPAMVIGMAR